eukprot:364961-Chlamydomonas_euryale.AAC.1
MAARVLVCSIAPPPHSLVRGVVVSGSLILDGGGVVSADAILMPDEGVLSGSMPSLFQARCIITPSLRHRCTSSHHHCTSTGVPARGGRCGVRRRAAPLVQIAWL